MIKGLFPALHLAKQWMSFIVHEFIHGYFDNKYTVIIHVQCSFISVLTFRIESIENCNSIGSLLSKTA